jgi:hypothetical protein
MEKLRQKIAEVKKRAEVPEGKRVDADRMSLEGTLYPEANASDFALPALFGKGPFATCSGTAGTFAAGMGCPALDANKGGSPSSLALTLRENKYCRITDLSDWEKFDVKSNPKVK